MLPVLQLLKLLFELKFLKLFLFSQEIGKFSSATFLKILELLFITFISLTLFLGLLFISLILPLLLFILLIKLKLYVLSLLWILLTKLYLPKLGFNSLLLFSSIFELLKLIVKKLLSLFLYVLFLLICSFGCGNIFTLDNL